MAYPLTACLSTVDRRMDAPSMAYPLTVCQSTVDRQTVAPLTVCPLMVDRSMVDRSMVLPAERWKAALLRACQSRASLLTGDWLTGVIVLTAGWSSGDWTGGSLKVSGSCRRPDFHHLGLRFRRFRRLPVHRLPVRAEQKNHHKAKARSALKLNNTNSLLPCVSLDCPTGLIGLGVDLVHKTS